MEERLFHLKVHSRTDHLAWIRGAVDWKKTHLKPSLPTPTPPFPEIAYMYCFRV
jgi:hypothetical protein